MRREADDGNRSSPFLSREARHIPHPEASLFPDGVADLPDAIFVLVEYVVWPEAHRPAVERISARCQEAAAHSAGAGTGWRAHHAARCNRQAVVSRLSASGGRSRGGGTQHRRVGHGTRHDRRRFSRCPVEDAQRSIADGSWQCGTLAGALRRCQWLSADCDAAATRGNYSSRIGPNCRRRPPRHRDHQGGLIAKLQYGHEQTAEIRSPIPGRIRSVAGTGTNIVAGAQIAVIDPSTEQVWEALRALYLVR